MTRTRITTLMTLATLALATGCYDGALADEAGQHRHLHHHDHHEHHHRHHQQAHRHHRRTRTSGPRRDWLQLRGRARVPGRRRPAGGRSPARRRGGQPHLSLRRRGNRADRGDWVTQPAFAESVRMLMQVKLTASGNKDGVDFELPGNLAAHGRNDRPLQRAADRELLRRRRRHGNPLRHRGAVSGRRADHARLPDGHREPLQPASRATHDVHLRLRDLPDGRAAAAAHQQDRSDPDVPGETAESRPCPRPPTASATARLLRLPRPVQRPRPAVRALRPGRPVDPDATGLQSPEKELGRSTNGLYASHFVSPLAAPQESRRCSTSRSRRSSTPPACSPAAPDPPAAGPQRAQVQLRHTRARGPADRAGAARPSSPRRPRLATAGCAPRPPAARPSATSSSSP